MFMLVHLVKQVASNSRWSRKVTSRTVSSLCSVHTATQVVGTPSRGPTLNLFVDFEGDRWTRLFSGPAKPPAALLKQRAEDFEVREIARNGDLAAFSPVEDTASKDEPPAGKFEVEDCVSEQSSVCSPYRLAFDDGWARSKEVLRQERIGPPSSAADFLDLENHDRKAFVSKRLVTLFDDGTEDIQPEGAASDASMESGEGNTSNQRPIKRQRAFFLRVMRVKGALVARYQDELTRVTARLTEIGKAKFRLARDPLLELALQRYFEEWDRVAILRFVETGYSRETLRCPLKAGSCTDPATIQKALGNPILGLLVKHADVDDIDAVGASNSNYATSSSGTVNFVRLSWQARASIPELFLSQVWRFELWKKNLSGPSLLRKLEWELKLPYGSIRSGGVKDKNAVTCQFLEIPVAGCTPEKAKMEIEDAVARLRSRCLPPKLDTRSDEENQRHRLHSQRTNTSSLQVGNFQLRSHGSLSWGETGGNRFKIVLRDIADISRVKENVERVRAHGFPNYFGPQRFGLSGNGYHRGGLKVDLNAASISKHRERQAYSPDVSSSELEIRGGDRINESSDSSSQNVRIGLALLRRDWATALRDWLGETEPGFELKRRKMHKVSNQTTTGATSVMRDDSAQRQARSMLGKRGWKDSQWILRNAAQPQVMNMWVLAVTSMLWNDVASATLLEYSRGQGEGFLQNGYTDTFLSLPTLGILPKDQNAAGAESSTQNIRTALSAYPITRELLERLYGKMLSKLRLRVADFDLGADLGVEVPALLRSVISHPQRGQIELETFSDKSTASLCFALNPGTYATSLLREIVSIR
ncbi:unnamed protein product [Amoebophrya sp. A25]|nr:unnamed protein product [Amoebophrya sp. A25]|eukprot:GSA25T00005649001.1